MKPKRGILHSGANSELTFGVNNSTLYIYKPRVIFSIGRVYSVPGALCNTIRAGGGHKECTE